MGTSVLNLGTVTSSLLIFGGPYSNLAATRAVLATAKSPAIPSSSIICTGDVVAYGAEPEQTCRLLIESGIQVVMGNCEESLANDSSDCGCGFDENMLCSLLSQKWYRYARQNISRQSREWMSGLPTAIAFDCYGKKFRVIHGGIKQINQFIFSSTQAHIKQQQLDELMVDCIIGGHSGIPFGQTLGEQYWLNAGVIGVPANDSTRQGWYLLIEPFNDRINISWHRLEYEFEKSARAMLQAGLDEYAESLLTGLWPSSDVLPVAEQSAQGQPLNIPDLTIHL